MGGKVCKPACFKQTTLAEKSNGCDGTFGGATMHTRAMKPEKSDQCSTYAKISAYSACHASSVYAGDAIGVNHGTGRLNSDQAWSAAVDSAGQWWQMDLGAVLSVGGVVTQGRNGRDQYVTSYKVYTSETGTDHEPVDGGKIFAANSAANNFKVFNKFAKPVNARYVRIVVETWSNHISMRAAVLLCQKEIPKATFGDFSVRNKNSNGYESW